MLFLKKNRFHVVDPFLKSLSKKICLTENRYNRIKVAKKNPLQFPIICQSVAQYLPYQKNSFWIRVEFNVVYTFYV